MEDKNHKEHSSNEDEEEEEEEENLAWTQTQLNMA
jgi:hypothetical protein